MTDATVRDVARIIAAIAFALLAAFLPANELPLATFGGGSALAAGLTHVLHDPSAWLVSSALAVTTAVARPGNRDADTSILFAVAGFLGGAAAAILWPAFRQGLPPLLALLAGLAGAAGLRAGTRVLHGTAMLLGAGLALYVLPRTGGAGGMALLGIGSAAIAGLALPAAAAASAMHLVTASTGHVAARVASAWLAAVAMLVLALDIFV